MGCRGDADGELQDLFAVSDHHKLLAQLLVQTQLAQQPTDGAQALRVLLLCNVPAGSHAPLAAVSVDPKRRLALHQLKTRFVCKLRYVPIIHLVEDEVVASDGGAARAAPRPAPLAPGTGHTLDISAHTRGDEHSIVFVLFVLRFCP